MPNYTRLVNSTGSFDEMIRRFGIVTVMNADIYEGVTFETSETAKTPAEVLADCTDAKKVCHLDTLKVANVPMEGPSKTITGGQYSNPLLKFGKSARLEMQDALGNIKAIDALGGGIAEWTGDAAASAASSTYVALHFGEDFNGPKTIVGDSFFLDSKGNQVKVKIIFYQFLPDSIFNLTQDAEGDATVFDMNGDLMTTVISIPDKTGTPISHGLFYSILEVVGE